MVNLKMLQVLKLKTLKLIRLMNGLKLDGLFIAIGHDPATALFKEQLDMDKEGYLITKPDSTETNIPGVYAAGDDLKKEIGASTIKCDATKIKV